MNIKAICEVFWASQEAQVVKMCLSVQAEKAVAPHSNTPASAGDADSAPGLGRSPGGHDNAFQYSFLENPWIEEPGGLQSTGSQSQTPLKRFSVHAHAVRYFTYSTFQSGLTTFLRPCRHMWLPATIIKQCINKMYKFLLDKAC